MFSRKLLRFPNIARRVINSGQTLNRRCLQVSVISFEKKFQQGETDYVYKFIQSYEAELKECKQIQNELKFQEDLSGKASDEFVEAFEALSHFCANKGVDISSDDFDHFVAEFVKKVPTFSDDQLFKVLTDLARFPQTKSPYTKNFLSLWQTLNVTCSNRVKDWNQPILFKFCGVWYKNHLAKLSGFVSWALVKICRRVDRLKPKELVEAMFYLGICRNKVEMMEVEKRFYQVFDSLDVNEIGIICLAFFKTETKMHTRVLLDKIYDKVIKNVEQLEDISMVNIMKALRYSSDPSHSSRMLVLCDAIFPNIGKYNLMTSLHIALLGTNLQYCHHGLLNIIVHKFNENLKATRLKDIERIAFILGLYDFKSENNVEKELCMKIIEELKLRVKEIVNHPKCLAACAHYLTISGVYDVDMIKSILNEDFISFAYGGLKIRRVLS